MDPYHVLGLSRNASDEEVKKAYKRSVMQHHPDKGGDAEKFKQVSEAYHKILKGEKTPPPPPPNFNDIFGRNGFGRGQPFNGRARARILLWIDLEDLIDSTPRFVTINGNKGVFDIEISIPPGLEDNDTVSYPNITPDDNDVLITFRIRPHSQFVRDGQNITKDLSVTVWDLILGTTTNTYNLAGSELKVTVPKGAQPGTYLKIPGHGLPNRHGGGHGDLLLRLKTSIPENIKPELIEQIKKLT